MLVVEGKQPWARSMRDRRSDGQGLPLPSVSFTDLLRMMVEGTDTVLMRMIVSFI